jgi:hypothetical protein
MFLITPDFTVRVHDVIKIVPRPADVKNKKASGTVVHINNMIAGCVDREFTTMPYKEVIKTLENAKHQ